GIFVGGLHDFGAMFASVRNGGKSVGEIIKASMGDRAKKLCSVFALLVLILVIASFVNVVAGTFYSDNAVGLSFDPTGNETTAMVSVLFIVMAVIYGMMTTRFGMDTKTATIIGLALIVGSIVFGLNVGLVLGRTAWIILVALYITVASLAPVWILLQPRDYLSSFLLYAMMGVAIIGIFMSAFTGTAEFTIPAFTGKTGMFPALFITVACGACSGFHSLIASGTSSKQLENEAHAKPIGYGSMLIESGLAIIALIAVGMVFETYTGGGFGSPSVAFAAGIATMFGAETSQVYGVVYALLTLAVSVFALTSLDSGTRLSRFMFSELFLKKGEASWKDATGIRKVLTHPLVGTLIMVGIGSVLGFLKLSQIWGLFGAANQLLAGLALMAVAAWLGNVGRNNKMFFIPMAFMLAATLTSLIQTIIGKFGMISAGTALWGDWFQLCFAAAMAILAVILVVEGLQTFSKQAKGEKTGSAA
ncbi:MAG: carbon starvation protein A, partial [Firmicutes bacterium]|nr:carbon starvation protein A [Bacillota bacterium]